MANIKIKKKINRKPIFLGSFILFLVIIITVFVSIFSNSTTDELFELNLRFVVSGTIDDYNITEIKHSLATRFNYNIENIIVNIVSASVMIIIRFIGATEKAKEDVRAFAGNVGMMESFFNATIESSISFQVDMESGTQTSPLLFPSPPSIDVSQNSPPSPPPPSPFPSPVSQTFNNTVVKQATFNSIMTRGIWNIPISNENELYLLVATETGANGRMLSESETSIIETPASRSYEGNDWEPIYPLLQNIECNTNCTLNITSSLTYKLVKRTTGEISKQTEISRFLSQVTFGPLLEEIYSLSDSENNTEEIVENWLTEQMNIPYTSHRKYYRERTNPRLNGEVAQGKISSPCKKGSRWRSYSFTNDDIGKTLIITYENSTINMFLENELVTKFQNVSNVALGVFTIDNAKEYINGDVEIKKEDTIVTIENPVINIDNISNMNASLHLVGNTGYGVLTSNIVCDTVPKYLLYNQTIYKFEPTLRSFQNDLNNSKNFLLQSTVNNFPVLCSSVSENFINSKYCTVQNTCASKKYNGTLYLNKNTFEKFYSLSRKYIYYVEGLRLSSTELPCKETTTRWKISNTSCAYESNINTTTKELFLNAINTSTDRNIFIKDLEISSLCSDQDIPVGATINFDGKCYQHVHQDYWNVYDFTFWTINHQGNVEKRKQGKRNPIRKFAELGTFMLAFPYSHPMSRWTSQSQKGFTYIGRYGDYINFEDLPQSVQVSKVADHYDIQMIDENDGQILSCGSYDEYSNKPEYGHKYSVYMNTEYERGLDGLYRQYSAVRGRSIVWTNAVLNAADQLRQRIAWSFIQVFVIGGEATSKNLHEPWLVYIDIFVRNAFGNFRRILKEVAFSPLMANYLTYRKNRGFTNSGSFPDENFAREFMQLFTIGLWKLEMNGTYTLDDKGDRIETYDNEDIKDFSRIWTGFNFRPVRGNIESAGTDNEVDPMKINSLWRDEFPKMDLNDGYIGDFYPQCTDLLDYSFLKKGSVYKLVGFFDPNLNKQVLVLTHNSTLYKQLYSHDLKRKKKISLSLSCENYGLNITNPCSVKDIKYVGFMMDNRKYVYYEYIKPPCIEFPFYTNPEVIKYKKKRNIEKYMCANPLLPEAGTCCSSVTRNDCVETCNYQREKVKFENLECTTGTIVKPWTASRNECDYKSETFMWYNTSCKINILINNEGFISIVHDHNKPDKYLEKLGTLGTSKFRVRWKNDSFPTYHNNCSLLCTKMGEKCYCEINVVTKSVFSTPPSIDILEDRLRIGSFEPDERYSLCNTSFCNSFPVEEVWTKGLNTINEDTIFKIITNNTFIKYLKNIESIVYIENSTFSFRNPPNFISIVDSVSNTQEHEKNIRDAKYEVDALIDHIYTHQNVPPFIANWLINRFITSNPSPRYVHEVSNAFKYGKYKNKTYSGKYGDLKASVYALFLDREARSSILDIDPSHGKMREPLLKIYNIMRSLQYKSRDLREIEFQDLQSDIGQQIFDAPSVFNFYMPEFQPLGAIKDMELFSPESQIYTTPNIIRYMSGVISLMRYGLTKCKGGFGNTLQVNKRDYDCSTKRGATGPFDTADGHLKFKPNNISNINTIINELSLLLTSGNMGSESRDVLKNAFNSVTDNDSGYRKVKELFPIVPEFHTSQKHTNINFSKPKVREIPYLNRDYKAIIVLFMHGGCDSYNLIVPHSECKERDMYQEYESIRGSTEALALRKNELLQISVPNNTQPCNKFGIHPKLPILQDLYIHGDAAFISTIGPLVEPLNKNNFKLKKKPFSLFSHNTQRTTAQNLHADSLSANGIFGRIGDALRRQNIRNNIYSMAGSTKILQGGAPPRIIGKSGIEKMEYSTEEETMTFINRLTEQHSTSHFMNTFSNIVEDSLNLTESLSELFANSKTATSFSDESLSKQLRNVARIMNIRQSIRSDRDMFFVQIGGFDTHSNMKSTVDEKFTLINTAISSFVEEMKNKSLWNDVVLMTSSDFGRTLTTNGRGSDHGWAGNMFMIGGSVNGSQIFGKYPDSLIKNDDNLIAVGRGRLIPTTPWEGMWKGVAEWFNISSLEMETVFPNLKNFDSSDIIGRDIMFT